MKQNQPNETNNKESNSNTGTSLPNQSGNAKKTLTTNGENPSWEFVDHSDLTNNGSYGHVVIDLHIDNINNPHSTSKSQIGLDKVDNSQQIPMSQIDNDTSLSSDSTNRIPTQYAIKTYINNAINRGLYSGILSPIVPTQANTGLNTQINQDNATVIEDAAGLTLITNTPTVDGFNLLYKSAPTAPYTITALFSAGVGTADKAVPGPVFGWRDSSTGKLHIWLRQPINSSPYQIYEYVQTYASHLYSAFSATHATIPSHGSPIWIRLIDDSTNIKIQHSHSGSGQITVYTVAKSGGYLGTNGYNQIVFDIDSIKTYTASVTMESYIED